MYIIKLLNRILFFVIFTELILGGGGRLLEVGGFTLRILMFLSILPISLLLVYIKKIPIDRNLVLIVLFQLFLLLLSSIIGIANHASLDAIYEDIKPQIFILFIFYAVYSFSDIKNVQRLITFVKIYSLLMGCIHITVFILLQANAIEFRSLWMLINNQENISGEFFFRGEYGFFAYKGYIYLPIGVFFWERYGKSLTQKYLAITILIIASILTGTRGYIVFVMLIYCINYLLKSSKKTILRNILIITGAVLISLIGLYIVSLDRGENAIDESDQLRASQLQEVFDATTIYSTIWGNGLGIGVPIRPVHMEIAYLEIFHKQGVLGLSFWVLLLLFIYKKYKDVKSEGKPFWFSCLFVYTISVSNPYINNPIGLTVIIFSIFCMDTIIKTHRQNNKKLSKEINNM